jgi:predicted alpha/beta superfamily hydrolase
MPKNRALLLILSLCSIGFLQAQTPKVVASSPQSSILKKTVKQMVRLPDSYAKSPQQKYPILFVLQVTDQMVEEIAGIAQKLHTDSGTPEMIVVGIDVEDKLEREQDGAVYDKFLSYMEQELIPSLEKKYRSNGQRILFGRSLSGSFTLYAMLSKPSLFNGYIAASKEWYDENNDYFTSLANKALQTPDKFKDRKIFLASLNGAYSNSNIPEVNENMTAFANLLVSKSGNKIASKYQAFDDWGISPHPGLKAGLLFVAKSGK